MREVSRFVLVLFVLVFVALQVQPEVVEIPGGVGADIDEVFTLVNDEPIPQEYEIRVHPFSEYLADAVSLSSERFFLVAQESANVQVRGEVPLLGPERHTLRYDVYAGGSLEGSFLLELPIDGVAELEPRLRVSTSDIVQGSSLAVDAVLSNFGNVIAYYDLVLEVSESGESVGTVSYPQPVQVLPGEETRVTLLYTDFLDPGEYVVEVAGVVNEEVSVADRSSTRVTLVSADKRISQGDDLFVELTRYNLSPRVSYSISQGGEELFSETRVVDGDVLVVPTAQLAVGEYVVAVSVLDGAVRDSQEFSLVVERAGLNPGWFGWLLVLSALIFAGFSRQSRLYLRIWWFSVRLHWREKRLNKLIYRAHELERRYES